MYVIVFLTNIAVLKAALDTPAGKQSGSDFEIYQMDSKVLRVVWTLSLNEFFYNYIYARNEEILESEMFAVAEGGHDYQIILTPRAYDSWRHHHCSLFLYPYGDLSDMPKNIMLRCRVPGVKDEDNIQYYEVQPNITGVSKEGDGCIIAKVYFFLSYSFFLQHLNVRPFFQIVVDIVL